MSDPALTPAEREKRAQIDRINELSRLVHAAWFSLLAYLAFFGVTLLGVRDADFFLPTRQTDLPLLGVSIPTASFYWTAPVIGVALYVYLHQLLIKLWEAHRKAGKCDADTTHHGLVSDFVLIRRRDATVADRPLAVPTDWITRLLLWAAGPIVMGYAWWSSMPAHDEGLTILIAAGLWGMLIVGFASWRHAAECLRPRERPAWTTRRGFAGTAIAGALLLVTVSWLRTEGGADKGVNGAIDMFQRTTGTALFNERTDPSLNETTSAEAMQRDWVGANVLTLADVTFTKQSALLGRWIEDSEAWTPLAQTDLTNIAFAPLPEDWRTPEVAERAFRTTWCEGEGLAMDVCGQPEENAITDVVRADREAWCEVHGDLAPEDCLRHFRNLEDRFSEAWREERRSVVEALPSLDLAGRDLRRAKVAGATLVNADLRGARLEGADLRSARMEGADLTGASLAGADLRATRLEGADLRSADLRKANLSFARLDGAVLRSADLRGADLTGARLDRATLAWARLRGAKLARARLGGAHLRWADLRDTDWGGTKTTFPVLAHGADLRGARNLTQAKLERWIGDHETLLPDGDAPDTGQPYYVWSCWDISPSDHDRVANLAARRNLDNADDLVELFYCGPDGWREEAGRPLRIHAAYPRDHPQARRQE